jgi:hypothetical protein
MLGLYKTEDAIRELAMTRCGFFMKKDMRDIKESYGRIGDNEDRFDVEFWQRQGDQAIFNAALDMIMDYLLVRNRHVDKPRLQRTVESFGKA